MTWLIDGNVLCALFIESHAHHDRADRWFADLTENFATCSLTQGTLLKLHMNFAEDQRAAAAWETLGHLVAHPQHEFWDEGYSYQEVPHRVIQGHRQVTDAWLVELARKKKAKVATFDKGLVAVYPEHSFLIPG